MKIVNQIPEELKEHVNTEDLKTRQLGTLNVLREAYAKEQIKISRALFYKMRLSPKGTVWYTVKYKDGKTVYYEGCFKLEKSLERTLQANSKLIAYLLAKLAIEMTA